MASWAVPSSIAWLVFAHNQHLRRDRSAWQLGERDLRWWSAGALTATRLGSGYAVIGSDLGSAPDHGLPAPDPATLEGLLVEATEDDALYPAELLAAELKRHSAFAARTDAAESLGYFALEATELSGLDAIASPTLPDIRAHRGTRRT